MKPETWAIVGGRPERVPGAPLNTPLVPASNFVLGTERLYSRTEATDTWEAFEEVLGGLEGGHAVSFSSGMAACNAVLSQLPTGAHLVIPDDCYQGVAGIAEAGARDHAWRVERVPAPDTETWIAKLLEADLVWLESPTNPLLDVADVAAICAAPRKDGVRVVVDNTFATPLLQQPLSLGADVVVHAATKFLGGHSDLLMGAAVAKDEAQRELLITARKLYGATPGVLEAFLATRGVRTLPVRLKTAIASAVELVARLDAHPAVQRVRYPGFGAVVSFELADAETVDRACAAIKIIWHATSLGGVETTMERRSVHPGQEHIPDGLIRMSVGCEDVEDLWADLEQALGEPDPVTVGPCLTVPPRARGSSRRRPASPSTTAWRDESLDPPALVVQVGKTEVRYHLRAIDDLHAMLKAHGDWMPLGSADEQKPAAEGTVEAWARSEDNPVGGWYGLKKGLRGRFANYVPPVLEALGLAEVEHNARNNRMRAL